MNETFYWIIEYLKVLAAYVLVLYVWPMIVFKGFLKNKNRPFKFAFCTVAMINIINTVVLLLGTVHCLNVWVVRVIFYGILLFSIVRNTRINKKDIKAIKHVTSGTMGRKTFYGKSLSFVGKWFKKIGEKAAAYFKANGFEFVFLIFLVIYAMVYFSWNAFQTYSYGASDMYVHNSWIYGLVEGEAFSAGIYPEGMHCFVYALYALFGIRIYSLLLFMAGINIIAVVVSAFIFFKELFKWKYSPVLVIALFLILDVKGAYPVVGMSRLAWSVPQEFGFPMIFLCAAYLIKYLKDAKRESWKKFFNENLIIFALALAGSISIHFYVTIMAFFVCLMIVIPMAQKLFKNKSFVQILAAIGLGVFISVLPMLLAFAGGKKFQGSINWALEYIKSSFVSDEREYILEEKVVELLTFNNDSGNTVAGAGIFNSLTAHKSTSRAITRSGKESRISNVYNQTYVFLFGQKRAALIVAFEIIGVAIWLAMKLFGIIKKKNDDEYDICKFDGYLSIVLVGIMFVLLNNFRSMGLPELFETGRVCAIADLLALAVLFIPLDLIMSFPLYTIPKIAGSVAAGAVLLGEIIITVASGNYHGYLFYWLGRYNAAVKCTISITEDMKKDNFTIVSTTDELYQIIQYGFHEETISFVNSVNRDDSYTLPSEYVFIFVEKKPIQYPHYNFASGPKWMADDRYMQYFDLNVSQYPDVVAGEINEEYAANDRYFYNANAVYKDLESRTILESKMYDWCQKFDELYPGELKTYYEDDDFVCYYFKQNPRNNYELSILD